MIAAIVIGCMDFRIQNHIQNLIKEHNLSYGDYDLVLIQGGAGNFEQLKEHLITAKILHNPQLIILTIHEDCGYGSTKDNFDKSIEICKSIFGENIKIIIKYIHL